MNHRRIHLWVSLIVGVAVWGGYFFHVVTTLRDGQDGRLALWFLGALGLVVALEAAATGALAWLGRRRARTLDEGPSLSAALKASHVALMLLVAMVLVLAAVLAVASLTGWTPVPATPAGLVIAANILLAMVVVAELSRAALTLALMPRG